MRCPNCRKPTDTTRANPYRPFCSERCQVTDLGTWAGEGYRIAGGKTEDRAHPDDLKKKPTLN
ncbi:MAG: DNA gyrase inhibitor YacG [Candidatus Binataceae bacterium]